MSIEQALAELTAAVKENTKAVLDSNALRTAAIDTIKDAASAQATSKKEAKKDAAAATTSAPAAETKPATETSPDGVVLITDEQQQIVAQKVAEYLAGADRPNSAWAEAERAARKDKVRKLLQHEKVIAPGVTFDAKTKSMMATGFPIFDATIAKFVADGDVTKEPASAGATLDL